MNRPRTRIPYQLLLGILMTAAPLTSRARDDLESLLAVHLEKYPALPSLSAVAVVEGEFRAAGAAGLRKRGHDAPVTINDRYHLGSCTKAFTAALGARLVEEGALSWDTTIGETLARLNPHPKLAPATLHQLLSNTGGLPEQVPSAIWIDAWEAGGSLTEQRKSFARAMLNRKPAYPPGKRQVYSNTGYAVAGVLMETATGSSWEDLVRARIFEPLQMKSSGFYGPARDPAEPDQPWGHTADGTPVPPGREADNPPAIAPAGAIHCSLLDLVPWLQMHLNRTTGRVLQQPESFEKLHTPVRRDYALGWIVTERSWADGSALTHLGSNTMYTTLIWIAPRRKFAVAVATNIGHTVAFKACDGVVGALIGKYLR